MISGKAVFTESDKPLLIDAFNSTNFLKPSRLRCSPLLILSKASFHN